MENKSFKIATVQKIDKEDAGKWVHWSEGLSMYIEKDGICLKLDSEEIQDIVKALPRTFGGTH